MTLITPNEFRKLRDACGPMTFETCVSYKNLCDGYRTKHPFEIGIHATSTLAPKKLRGVYKAVGAVINTAINKAVEHKYANIFLEGVMHAKAEIPEDVMAKLRKGKKLLLPASQQTEKLLDLPCSIVISRHYKDFEKVSWSIELPMFNEDEWLFILNRMENLNGRSLWRYSTPKSLEVIEL